MARCQDGTKPRTKAPKGQKDLTSALTENKNKFHKGLDALHCVTMSLSWQSSRLGIPC